MPVLILDTTVLSCFARANRLGLLHRLCAGYTVATTPAVVAELRQGAINYPRLAHACELPWIKVETLETVEELCLLAIYADRLVAGQRNLGETEVLAKAEHAGFIPVTDDQAAITCAKSRDLQPRRTLALIARGIRKQIISLEQATHLVEELQAGGARFPCTKDEFHLWASERGLLHT